MIRDRSFLEQGKTNPAFPYLVFGILNIIVGLLSLLLPESKGSPLPSTFAEAVELEKSAEFCSALSSNEFYGDVRFSFQQEDAVDASLPEAPLSKPIRFRLVVLR